MPQRCSVSSSTSVVPQTNGWTGNGHQLYLCAHGNMILLWEYLGSVFNQNRSRDSHLLSIALPTSCPSDVGRDHCGWKSCQVGQGCCYWDEAKGPQVMRGEAHGGPEGWWWQQVWPPLTQLPGHSWTLSFSFQDLVFSLIPTISSSQFSFFCNERNLTAFPLLFSLYCITELFPSNSGEIA